MSSKSLWDYILKSRDLVYGNIQFVIGNGSSTSFWHDLQTDCRTVILVIHIHLSLWLLCLLKKLLNYMRFLSPLCQTPIRFPLVTFRAIQASRHTTHAKDCLSSPDQRPHKNCEQDFGNLTTLFLWGETQAGIRVVKLGEVLAYHVISSFNLLLLILIKRLPSV